MSPRDPHQDPAVPDVAAIVDRNWQRIFRLCRGRLPDEQLAEDATQETFLRLWRTRTEIADVDRWLTAVAVRVCLGIHRQRYGRPEEAMPETFDVVSDEDVAEEASDAAWMEQLGRRLRPSDYRLLVWLYVQRLPAAEVARRLGISDGNVRIMAFRARQRARDALGEMGRSLGIGLAAWRTTSFGHAGRHLAHGGVSGSALSIVPYVPQFVHGVRVTLAVPPVHVVSVPGTAPAPPGQGTCFAIDVTPFGSRFVILDGAPRQTAA